MCLRSRSWSWNLWSWACLGLEQQSLAFVIEKARENATTQTCWQMTTKHYTRLPGHLSRHCLRRAGSSVWSRMLQVANHAVSSKWFHTGTTCSEGTLHRNFTSRQQYSTGPLYSVTPRAWPTHTPNYSPPSPSVCRSRQTAVICITSLPPTPPSPPLRQVFSAASNWRRQRRQYFSDSTWRQINDGGVSAAAVDSSH